MRQHLFTKKVGFGLLLLATVIACLITFHEYLSFEYIKQQQKVFEDYYAQNPGNTLLAYSAVFILTSGLGIPSTGILLILSGALFGFFVGTALCAVLMGITASLVFLWSRYLFQEFVDRHFQHQLEVINKGLEEEGAYFLFSIRLVPIFPFFVINILCGMTHLAWHTYFIATFLASIIFSAVFNYAGLQLSQMNSLNDVFSAGMLSAVILIGLVPLIVHRTIPWLRGRKKQ